MRKIAIALSLLAAVAPAVAFAQGSGVRIRVTYYSGVGGQVVGEFVELCNGSSYWNGYPTEHSAYEEYDC